ncbi:MAG: hypothetical protein OSJ70_05040 [Bacilli bacterium]|nr:hypothetical protein [Bacilli bacterium]
MEKEKFDKNKYKQKFNQEKYKPFKVDLKKEELEEMNELLTKIDMTKADFLRKAIEQLKNGQIKKDQEN